MSSSQNEHRTGPLTIVVTDPALTAARYARVVLCLTDDGHDRALWYARRAAASLTRIWGSGWCSATVPASPGG
jgi:hypothetical protein